MENKMTAVEWLFEEITGLKVKGNFELFKKDLEKAKAMEKKQIEDTYWDAYKEGQCSSDKTAEQYYNETYNQ